MGDRRGPDPRADPGLGPGLGLELAEARLDVRRQMGAPGSGVALELRVEGDGLIRLSSVRPAPRRIAQRLAAQRIAGDGCRSFIGSGGVLEVTRVLLEPRDSRLEDAP